MTGAGYISQHILTRIFVVLLGISMSFPIAAQEEVRIIPDYDVMYCSATHGEILAVQKIKLLIKGPENKKWFASYSINNSPEIVLNGNEAIEFSEYEFSLFLRNTSGQIQNYTIELKKAWLEDFSELSITKGFESATIQVLPLPEPEFDDYFPRAKAKSIQNYSVRIGKNSSYSVMLPEGVELVEETDCIVSNKKEINLRIKWPAKKGRHVLKLIETDALGCNSDTVYAGIEVVENFSVDLSEAQYICKGENAELKPIMDLPAEYSFEWSTGAQCESISVNEAGTYHVTVTDLADMQKITASVSVKMHETPEIPIDDHVILLNQEHIIDIYSEACTYLWSDGCTNHCNTFSKSGTYSVTITSEHGCSNSKSFKAKLQDEIFELELPQVIHMCGNEKTTLCPHLSIDQEYTFKWYNGSTESSIPIEKAGEYTVTVTDPDGFWKTATTKIQYHPNPIVDLGADLVLWEGESAKLTAQNPGASYVWNNGETTQSIIANSGGTYVVTVFDLYGCSNKDSIYIDYKHGQKFGVFLGENQVICQGDSVYVDVQFEGNPVSPITYNWVGTNNDSPEIYLKDKGEFCVEVTDANGNTESDCIDIKVNETPNVNLGQDIIASPDNKIILDTKTPNCSYIWSTGEITSKISANRKGEYWVKVTNEFNCTSSDTIIVEFYEDHPYVGLPKAFSPNGDGCNDKLFIRGSEIKDATLIIYNRLGQKLFETTSINNGWDGFFKGKLLEIDVYIYVLEITFLDGKKLLKKGDVALLR